MRSSRSRHNIFISLWKQLRKLFYRLKHQLTLTIWRKVTAIIVFSECLFYIRCKYMAYYVTHHLPIDCTLPPINKDRLLEIRHYAQLYVKYHRGARRKSLIEVFANCKLTDLKRGNIERFLSWAYFLKYDESVKKTLTPQEVKWRDDLIASTINDFESEMNYRFPEGLDPDRVSLSNVALNKRPLITTYHPLMMYLWIHLGPKQVSNFIFGTIFGFESQFIRGLKVWSKMTSTKSEIHHFEPICYFGGVSAGNPGQAVMVMFKLQRKWGNTRNLFVIEVPWSEMSIHHFVPFSNRNYVTNKVALSMDEITDILIHIERVMLHRNGVIDHVHSGWYGSGTIATSPRSSRSSSSSSSSSSSRESTYSSSATGPGSSRSPSNDSMSNSGSSPRRMQSLRCQWNLMGESFGSFICSAIYQRIKSRSLGVIPRLILIDAPTLCMTDPSAGKLVGVKEEVWWRRWFQIAVGEEMMIATMAVRYFHWFDYCLYPHDLVNDGCRKGHIIVSGTKDHLIPINSIINGVKDANELCRDEGKRIVHVVMEGVHHGMFLVHPRYQDMVIDLL